MRARSLLYVPASRPRMLAQLPGLGADAVVLDLEDGVAPPDKEAARTHLREAAAAGLLERGPAWTLRVNPPDAPWHADDLALAAELRAPRVLLPKAESPEVVARLAGLCAGRGGALGLMLETAGGVGRARELAGVAGVDMLVLGSADYRLALGARADDERRWELHALHEVLLAARMHARAALDSVYFRLHDDAGLERHARVARDLGYDGKSCIHPGQLPTIHRVWAASADELAWARAVRRAWQRQDGDRRGVVVLDDGEMVEALHVELARRILERGEP